MCKRSEKQKGFTIVELLIVIVVIGILAAITLVAYNGIQQRGRDANIQAMANQIQKNLQLWYLDTGVLPAAGYGSTGAAANDACPGNTTTSGGWFQSGLYFCTMQDLLKARGYLTNNLDSTLPKNTVTGSSSTVFMFYNCGTGRYILIWTLESPSPTDTSNYNSNMATCGLNAAFYTTNYGMRAANLVNF